MAGVKHKSIGHKLYRDYFEGLDLHEIDGKPMGDVILISNPPAGFYKVVNIYCNKADGKYKLVIEHTDEPET